MTRAQHSPRHHGLDRPLVAGVCACLAINRSHSCVSIPVTVLSRPTGPGDWRPSSAVTSANKLVSCCCCRGGGGRGGAGRGGVTQPGAGTCCHAVMLSWDTGEGTLVQLQHCSPCLQPCSGGPTNPRPLMSRSSLTIGRRQTLALGRARASVLCLLARECEQLHC